MGPKMKNFRAALICLAAAALAAGGCGGEAEMTEADDAPVLEAIAADATADPVRTAEAFLSHVMKIHERVRADETAAPFLAEIGEGDTGSSARVGEGALAKWRRHGLEPPVHIFGNDHFGRTSCAIFLFIPFTEYSVISTDPGEAVTIVKVRLSGTETAAFNAFSEKSQMAVRREAGAAMEINFKLRKGGDGWSIVETAGDLDEIISLYYAIIR